MGVDWADATEVSKLLGLKTLINEFVAYKKLGDLQATKTLSVITAGSAVNLYKFESTYI